MKLKKLTVIYILICYVFLIYNLYFVSKRYLKYQTDTNSAMYIPIMHPLVKVSLCFNSESLLSKKVQKSLFDVEIPRIFNQTSKFIFENTPRADQLLGQCQFRDFERDVLWQKSGPECTKLFNIKRYRMQVYMCYKLDLNMTKEFNFYLLTHSFLESGKLFRFDLKSPFDEGHKILALVHFDDLPHVERFYSQEIVLSLAHPQKYDLYYDLFEIQRLPSPYETACKMFSRHECWYNCETRIASRLNYSSDFQFDLENNVTNDIRVVSILNHNKTLYDEINSKCNKLCGRTRGCRQKWAYTFSTNIYEDKNVSMNVETAKYPMTQVVHTASFTLGQFLTEFFNLMSIWLGFSFYTLFSKLTGASTRRAHLVQHFTHSLDILFQIKEHLTRVNLVKSPPPSDQVGQVKGPTRHRCLASLTFQAATAAILIWQLVNVSSKYFKYETQLRIRHDMNPPLRLPNLALCIKMDDYFNFSLNPIYGQVDRVMEEASSKMQFGLDELFNKFTLDSKIVSSCRIRNFSAPYWTVELLDEDKCKDEFEVTKYYLDLQMCYGISPIRHPSRKYRLSNIKMAGINPGVLYSIIPHSILKNFVSIELILFFGDFPYLSKEFAASSLRTLGPKLQVLTYDSYRYSLLPPPYDTMCVDEHIPQPECYMRGLKNINRLPWGGLFTEPLPRKLLSYSDLKNETINKLLLRLERKCNRIKVILSCKGSYTQTFISRPLDRTDFDIEFIVQATRYPIIKRRWIARVTLYEFYFQTLCCLNFWLGFTFVASNPIRCFARRKWHRVKCSLVKHLAQINDQIYWLHRIFVGPQVKLEAGGSTIKANAMNKLTRLIKSSLLIVICLIGCCLSLVYTVSSYLMYPVLIENSREVENSTNYSLTICSDRSHEIGKNHSSFQDTYIKRSVYLNTSVATILKITPDPEELVAYCRLFGTKDSRKYNDLTKVTDRVLVTYDKIQDCLDQFEMKKFVVQSNICYTYWPKKKLKWNRDQIISKLNYPKIFFMIGVKSRLFSKRIRVAIGESTCLPDLSFMWARKVINLNRIPVRWHVASYLKFRQNVLNPPYSQQGFTHMLHMKCIDNCINRKFYWFNLTFSSMFDEPNDLRYINYVDRVDGKMNSRVQNVSSYCTNLCRSNHMFRQTEFNFTSTLINDGKSGMELPFLEYQGHMFTIYVRSTDSPVFVQIFKPEYSFFELVINIGSIIGIWCGISVIDINPFKKQLKPPPHQQVKELHLFLDKLQSKCSSWTRRSASKQSQG